MNDHIGEANEMSETPRTDVAYFKNGATMYDLAGEMKLVERELNSANAEVDRLTAKVAQLYEGAEEQNQRIKRLEELGNDLHDGWRGNRNNKDKYFEAWRKAKEAKP